MIRDKEPPEEYAFADDRHNAHTFVKCGQLGNLVIYKEK
jgi:hypothetical protein